MAGFIENMWKFPEVRLHFTIQMHYFYYFSVVFFSWKGLGLNLLKFWEITPQKVLKSQLFSKELFGTSGEK